MDIFLFFCIILISCNVKANGPNETNDSATLENDDYVVVETVSGKLRGKVLPAVGKKGKVAYFLGIPYAEKPIEELRFTDPLPKEKWEGTRDSFHHGSPCQQFDIGLLDDMPGIEMWKSPIATSEDCLYLNVWVPYPLPKNYSVMVWIHGGVFFTGSSSTPSYNGEILAGYTDVIVVSFNYRLVSYGFLASGDDRIKGNFGLKDQLLALKWVKNNIAQFGGNPSSITIFGENTGASSIRHHLISSLADNLFHQVIMQSGLFHPQYSFASNDLAKFHFKKLLSSVNCSDDKNVLSCLQQVSTNQLNNYLLQSMNMNEPFRTVYLPVIDGDFIKEDPRYSLDKNDFKKMPTLLIVNKNEGFNFLVYIFPKYMHLKNECGLSSKDFYTITDEVCKDFSPNTRELIRYIYTDWTDSTSTTKNRNTISKILGDKFIGCPIHHFVEATKAYNPGVYLAEFNYRSSNDKSPECAGVYHGEELQFVFGHPFKSSGYSEKDRIISHRVMTYWSNFAKFGNPNGDPAKASLSDINTMWPPLNHEHQHLEITDEIKIGQHLKDNKCQFWNEVVPVLSRLSCSTN